MNRWKKKVRGNLQRAFGDELVMVGKRKIFGDPFLLQKIEIRAISTCFRETKALPASV